MCRRIFFTCLGCGAILIGLLVVAVAVVYFNVTRPLPPVPGQSQARKPDAPPTPRERQNAEQTVRRIAREIGDVKPRATRTRQRTFTMRVTETEANEILSSLPEVRETLDESQVSGLRVGFDPGRITVQARLPVWKETQARVSATVRIQVKEGKLSYQTEDARVGDFPAPPAMRQELDRQLADQFRQLLKRVPGRIDAVTITDNLIEVRGTRRPNASPSGASP